MAGDTRAGLGLALQAHFEGRPLQSGPRAGPPNRPLARAERSRPLSRRDAQRVEELFARNHQLREQQRALKENLRALENRWAGRGQPASPCPAGRRACELHWTWDTKPTGGDRPGSW